MLERSAEERLLANGEEIHVLSVLDFTPLPTYPELSLPSNPPNLIPPAHAFPPHWPWNLASTALKH